MRGKQDHLEPIGITQEWMIRAHVSWYQGTLARVRSWDILIFFKWSQLNLTLDWMHAATEGKEPRTVSRVFP